MMASPFTYVESAGHSKVHAMRGTEDDAAAEKDYVPFLVNRAFSFHPDTLGDANRMNQAAALPKRLQYDFFFHAVRPRKRYSSRWPKKKTLEDVDAICRYFGLNQRKALAASRLLRAEELACIYQSLETGGLRK